MTEEIELLRKIVENTDNNTTVIVAAITGAFTVLAAGITAFFTYLYSVKKDASDKKLEVQKIRAGLISRERLRWLQDLRENVSSFYTCLDIHLTLLRAPFNPTTLHLLKEKIDEIRNESIRQYHDISILLNPEKEFQKELFESTAKTLTEFNTILRSREGGNINIDSSAYSASKNISFEFMAKLGNETWTQVKSLE